MDILVTIFLFFCVLFEIFLRKKEKKKNIEEQMEKGISEWGAFVFSDERGVRQQDNDPYLNSEYDNGPDW